MFKEQVILIEVDSIRYCRWDETSKRHGFGKIFEDNLGRPN